MLRRMDTSPERVPSPTSPWAVDARGARAALLALAALPLALLLAKVYQHGLAFPYWDAWHFLEYLSRAREGNLGLSDLWAQHNEHRPLFPRLWMLALALASGWDVRLELASSIGLAGLTLGLLFWMARQTLGAVAWALLPVLSAVIFSWTQMENWVWGWQLQIFLCVAAVAGMAAVFASGLSPVARVAGAALLGLVAMYSFASGLLVWVAFVPALMALPVERRAKAVLGLLWCAVAVVATLGYFAGYRSPEVSPSLWTVARDPLGVLGYFVVLLGGPVSALFTQPAWHGVGVRVPVWAFGPGLALLVVLVFSVARLARSKRLDAAHAPWISLALLALGAAAVVAAGRAGLGLEQALTSRYITLTNLGWIAGGVLLLAALAPQLEARLVVGMALGGLLVAFAALGTSRYYEQLCAWKQMGWIALRAGSESRLFLQDLCDQPDALRVVHLPEMRALDLRGFDGPLENRAALAKAFLAEAEVLAGAQLAPQAAIYREVAAILTREP